MFDMIYTIIYEDAALLIKIKFTGFVNIIGHMCVYTNTPYDIL